MLRRFPCLQLQPAVPRLGGCGRPGLGLDEVQCQMVQRFEPTVHHCEGFFIANFLKVTELPPTPVDGCADAGEGQPDQAIPIA